MIAALYQHIQPVCYQISFFFNLNRSGIEYVLAGKKKKKKKGNKILYIDFTKIQYYNFFFELGEGLQYLMS